MYRLAMLGTAAIPAAGTGSPATIAHRLAVAAEVT